LSWVLGWKNDRGIGDAFWVPKDYASTASSRPGVILPVPMIFSWPSTHPDPMCKLSLIDVVHTPVFTEPVNDLINLFNSGDRLRSACAMVSKAGVQSVGAPEPKKLEVQSKINAPLYSAGIPTLRIQTSSRKLINRLQLAAAFMPDSAVSEKPS
jgi:hypothetical protein